MNITFNANAYKPTYESMEDIESGDSKPYILTWDDTTHDQIGTAVVTVTLFEKADLHERQMKSLNEKLQTVRAENQKRENAILDQISKLQALTYVEAA